MKAAILTIGDEILNGSTLDTNASFMAKNAIKEGIEVVSIMSVSDTEKDITDALNYLKSKAKIIFITGGLGPTKDDITIKTLANYFSVSLIFNEENFLRINKMLSDRNIKNIVVPKESCMYPKNAILLKNKKGTAPCMWIQEKNITIVSMPGVPLEMKQIFVDEVLPKIKITFRTEKIINNYILTAGIWESAIAKKIETIENKLPKGISLAYLPKLGQVTLRLTGKSYLKDELDFARNKIVEKLSTNVFSQSENESLEKIIGDLLKQKNATLSTAESCTGGTIASKITSVAGSSAYFKGSIVSYSNELKINVLKVQKTTIEKYGAVSEPTVIEMAKGALKILKTDYSIAVTGISGPSGGTIEKPVGTVWIAVANKKKVITKRFQFWPFRKENIELSSVAALNMLKNFIA